MRWMRPRMGWGGGGSAGSSTRISCLHGAEWLVELRGFEPMAIAGAERFRANPLFASQRARPARGSRLLDRDRCPRLGVLFWCRSQASQSSPRRKADRSRLGGEPPASLIAVITDNKQAVVDALQRAEAEADRWRCVLREKSDLVMRARGLPEYESRCEAYGIILVEYLNGSMLDTDPRVCAWCGKPNCR